MVRKNGKLTILINYFLIFYNSKYINLLNKYPYNKGKLFLYYFLCSMFIPIIALWINIIFLKLGQSN